MMIIYHYVTGRVVERRACHGGMMTAAGWIVAVDKLVETGQIVITDCDANFAVGKIPSASQLALLTIECAVMIQL